MSMRKLLISCDMNKIIIIKIGIKKKFRKTLFDLKKINCKTIEKSQLLKNKIKKIKKIKKTIDILKKNAYNSQCRKEMGA